MSHSHDDGVLRAPRRNRFFYGKMMGAPQFELEQRYGMDQRHLIQRLAIGSGVLCGLEIRAEGGLLHISPGVAIDGHGREIVVPEEATLDPWTIAGDGCGAPTAGRSRDAAAQVVVKLCYDECKADYGPVAVGTRCGTSERSEAGTIVETYRLAAEDYLVPILDHGTDAAKFPQVARKTGPEDVARLIADRRTCGVAADPCVPLAIVSLGEGGTIGDIDTSNRRELASNEVLVELVQYLVRRVQQLEAIVSASNQTTSGEDT